jgi:hypothetical protein
MSPAKLDFKRELRELYSAPRTPVMVDVPELAFLMVDGHDDPNTSHDYRDAIEALYSVSYTLKFAIKRGSIGLDYSVMPLESLWWGRDVTSFPAEDKSSWSWTAMIMQPDVVTGELVSEAIGEARAKRPLAAAAKLRLERFGEGLSAQVLHIGPYAAEVPTIERLHAFIAAQARARRGKHHEIYLGDPHRSAPEKLRTIIRQPVS